MSSADQRVQINQSQKLASQLSTGHPKNCQHCVANVQITVSTCSHGGHPALDLIALALQTCNACGPPESMGRRSCALRVTSEFLSPEMSREFGAKSPVICCLPFPALTSDLHGNILHALQNSEQVAQSSLERSESSCAIGWAVHCYNVDHEFAQIFPWVYFLRILKT